ncbi:MAG: CopG family transcriptional regulator [Chloroflexi bacterium]|nr:CopG family transcriptional regulator [Chloroflexota bacterium]
MRRTQIYLTLEESATLDRAAQATGKTRSSLIRDAVEARYMAAPERDETLRVLRETSGAWRREPGDEAFDSVEFVRGLRGRGLGRKLRPGPTPLPGPKLEPGRKLGPGRKRPPGR